MTHDKANSTAAEQFSQAAAQFCSIVEGASGMERAGFLLHVYQILPQLIAKAISLPQFHLGDNAPVNMTAFPDVPNRPTYDQWSELYNLLKEKLGEWDVYSQVFDPISDKDAILGSLSDDIADIYRDLKEGLVLSETHQSRPEDIVWEWRLLYYSHWGKHAIDALLVIHFRLQETLS